MTLHVHDLTDISLAQELPRGSIRILPQYHGKLAMSSHKQGCRADLNKFQNMRIIEITFLEQCNQVEIHQ
jgi:hypothetical protein